jgi:glycosyltransferase involved in cell wall biosynthesis
VGLLKSESLGVCIVAENASLRFGGEASLPLHYFARLRARGVEAWLIVHARTRAELEALFPHERIRILFIEDRWFHKLIWKLSRYLPRRVAEATFGTLMVLINQYMQRRLVRNLVATSQVDVVHQPVPVSPRAPSFLFRLGVPVVIGPMNGGMEYPPAFRSAESWLTRISIAMARRSANLVNRVIPGKTLANILLVANHRTRLALPSHIKADVLELPENGVDLNLWSAQPQIGESCPRFIFVGRLVDWKRLDLAIHALLHVPTAQLEIVGDGPMRQEWTALADRLGLGNRIRFVGWLPQSDCALHLHSAIALLLPSVYECGGAVVLEAMASAIPVIATAWGGPADYIDETCGILVAPSSTLAIIDGFAAGMQRLIDFPAVRQELGKCGRRRVEEQFDWDKKIDHMLQVYRHARGTTEESLANVAYGAAHRVEPRSGDQATERVEDPSEIPVTLTPGYR